MLEPERDPDRRGGQHQHGQSQPERLLQHVVGERC
jgi:hypothetical protein